MVNMGYFPFWEKLHLSYNEFMKTMQERLKYAIKEDGRSMAALSRAVGMNEDWVSSITRDNVKSQKPNAEKVGELCQELKINYNWLMFNAASMKGTPDFDADKLQIMGYVDAGITEMYIDQSETQIETETLPYKDGNKYIGFRVRGSSMMPRFKEGEVIIFNKDFEEITHMLNDEVLITLNNGARLVKILKKNPDGGFLLVSHNPAYADIAVSKEEISEVRRFKGIDR